MIKNKLLKEKYIKTHKILEKFESPGLHNQLYLNWDRAKGCYIYSNKKKIIDFTSSIFLANIGHSNSLLLKSLKKTLSKPLINSYNYINNNRIEYIKQLKKFLGNDFSKIYLLSTGSEASEAAIKLMRLYAKEKKKRRPIILSLEGNWHGRTLGAQMLSSNKNEKSWIGYNDPNILHLPFPYPWNIKESNSEKFFIKSLKILKKKKINFKKDICGFMLEGFQGWGAIFYPKQYVKSIESFCKKNDIILAFDEQQSGFGRTGNKFAYNYYNVKPDIICCGKGMGSGFPLAGVFAKKGILDLAKPGSMSSTHSANPLACTAGLATLREIKRLKLINRAKFNGEYLHLGLKKIMLKYQDFIFSIEGKGLIAAIIFKKNIKHHLKLGSELADKVCFACLKNNLLLVRTGRESIKIGPPLIINKSIIRKALKIIDVSIQEALGD